jgi:hypothetical protein
MDADNWPGVPDTHCLPGTQKIAMNPIFATITAGLNTITSVIKAQSAKLSEIISVDQQATAYHAGVDLELIKTIGGTQQAQIQQQTIIIAVLVVGVVLFLIMVMFIH